MTNKDTLASREIKRALIRRGFNEQHLAQDMAKCLGVHENTARRLLKEPWRITVANLRSLHLTVDELVRVVG